MSFKNYHLIHFLSLSLWKISHIYKSREHYNQPSILVQLQQLSPLPFYLFEESSAVFLYNIPYSGFVSHSVIYFFLLFPGPRRLINSGYTFGSLHHMRRHMRVISVLAMVLFSWDKCYLSPLKYVFPFVIITESRVTLLQHGYKAFSYSLPHNNFVR